jgi:pimeloyl-ACP methyl ester carboxylesterase
VLVGEQDETFAAVSTRMAATISGARLVVIEDAGHSPQFENGPAWLEALREFLADVDAESSAA